MAKYRRIHVKIWSDPDFESLPKDPKFLFIYLLTNAHRNESAVYPLSRKRMCDETGLSPSDVDASLNHLKTAEMVAYDEEYSVIWVKNAIYYADLNPNCCTSILTDLRHCPSKKIVGEFQAYYKDFVELEGVMKGLCRGPIGIGIGLDINKKDRGYGGKEKEPPPKSDQTQYAENVAMSKVEHDKLVKSHGLSRTQKAVEVLDNWKADKIAQGKTKDVAGSDYRKILKWAMDKVYELEQRGRFKPVAEKKKVPCPYGCGTIIFEGSQLSHQASCPKFVPASSETVAEAMEAIRGLGGAMSMKNAFDAADKKDREDRRARATTNQTHNTNG